jgi:hypothetical protein
LSTIVAGIGLWLFDYSGLVFTHSLALEGLELLLSRWEEADRLTLEGRLFWQSTREFRIMQ